MKPDKILTMIEHRAVIQKQKKKNRFESGLWLFMPIHIRQYFFSFKCLVFLDYHEGLSNVT